MSHIRESKCMNASIFLKYCPQEFFYISRKIIFSFRFGSLDRIKNMGAIFYWVMLILSEFLIYDLNDRAVLPRFKPISYQWFIALNQVPAMGVIN